MFQNMRHFISLHLIIDRYTHFMELLSALLRFIHSTVPFIRGDAVATVFAYMAGMSALI